MALPSKLAGTRSDRSIVEQLNLKESNRVRPHLFETLQHRMKTLTGKEPREGQILALYHIVYGQQDVLFQAATGYGKSMIWQCAPGVGNGIALMISPLNMLTEDQVALLPAGSIGVALTGENNSDKTYADIAAGKYTHICMGPEIATSRRFAKQVIEQESFRRRRLFLIIDEVHVVDQWSTFRKDYGKLPHLRTRLPPSTRALGVSATLDPATYAAVIVKGGFRNPVFINTTTDRPEIYIEFRKAVASKTSFEDLHFLFPDTLTVEKARVLPKTIVYFDSKQDIRGALATCRDWLSEAGLQGKEIEDTVGAYYASLREKTKKAIRDSFRKADSPCRIMLVTEAMGMGVEMEKIEIIVQYGSIKILRDAGMVKSLVQRMGRGARIIGEQGHFIWLVQPWFFYSPTQSHAPTQPSQLQNMTSYNSDNDEITHSVSDQKKWTNLDTIYQALSKGCPRKVLQETFIPPGSRFLALPAAESDRCCYRCHPNLLMKSRTAWTAEELKKAIKSLTVAENERMREDRYLLLSLPSTHILKSTPKRFGPVLEALRDWRDMKTQELYGEAGISYSPVLLLPDVAAEKLAYMNMLCTEELGEQFIEHFLPMWPRREEFSREVQALIRQVCQRPSKEGRDQTAQRKKDRVSSQIQMADELRVRLVRRRRRYGDDIPGSALAGDDVEKHGFQIEKSDQLRVKKDKRKANASTHQRLQDKALEYRPTIVDPTSPLTSPPPSPDDENRDLLITAVDASLVIALETQSPSTPQSIIVDEHRGTRNTVPQCSPSTLNQKIQYGSPHSQLLLRRQDSRAQMAGALHSSPRSPLEKAGVSRSGRQRHATAKYTASQHQAVEMDGVIDSGTVAKGRKRNRTFTFK